MKSPYQNATIEMYDKITQQLIHQFPLSMDELVNSVLVAWEKIKETKIGGELQIGKDIFPSPQITGNYLHELIPIVLQKKFPEQWRKEKEKKDKDIVYIPDNDFSIEIKTSSNPNNIYGNRSYGQENSDHNSGKSKYGYYLTINFEKFSEDNPNPKILKIRFGWIDHSEWKAQASQTGQQSTLSSDARDHKLKLIYSI